MGLSPKAIEELKAIYRRAYGRDLPDDAAWDMGYRLLALFDVLTRRPGTPPNTPHRKLNGDHGFEPPPG